MLLFVTYGILMMCGLLQEHMMNVVRSHAHYVKSHRTAEETSRYSKDFKQTDSRQILQTCLHFSACAIETMFARLTTRRASMTGIVNKVQMPLDACTIEAT